jgi:hypothetical protein
MFQAIYTEMGPYPNDGPVSGQILSRVRPSVSFNTAKSQAADALVRIRTGQMVFKNYVVRACECKTGYAAPDIGLKVFDAARRSSGGFMTGNVMSNVQTSTYVRAQTNIKCNGFTFKEGELRASDLKWVTPEKQGASTVQSWFSEGEGSKIKDIDTILYFVFHRGVNKKTIAHGWLLTDTSGNLLKQIRLNNNQKYCHTIMDQALEVATNERYNEQDVLVFKDGVEVYVDPDVLTMAQEMMQYSEVETEPVAERARGG